MNKLALVVWLATAVLFAGEAPNTLTAVEKEQGYRLLFDGKSLAGWDGDPELWSVKYGAIVGSTVGREIPQNSFLVSQESYSDFILQIDVNVRNHNSGVQFRSEVLPEWVVAGYQADAAEGNWWGSLYGEKTGRGVIVDGWKGKGEKVVRRGDWNHYEIICRGKQITITLNGLVTADLQDDMASEGVIALQLHRGPPMQAWFRNIKIRPLR